MKPDFDMMTLAELRSYVLEHRNDDEAFYRLADRLSERSADAVSYPVPDTPETIDLMKTAIQERITRLGEKSNS